jgi:hypothetical protein
MGLVTQQVGLVHVMLPGASEHLDGCAAALHCGLQAVLQCCLPGWRLAWPDRGGAQVNLRCGVGFSLD